MRVVFIFLFIASTLCSDECIPEALARKILREQPNAIKQIQGDRIYLRVDNIYIENGRIYLGENSEIPLPGVFSNGSEVYIKSNFLGEFVQKLFKKKYWRCDGCTTLYEHVPRNHYCDVCEAIRTFTEIYTTEDIDT